MLRISVCCLRYTSGGLCLKLCLKEQVSTLYLVQLFNRRARSSGDAAVLRMFGKRYSIATNSNKFASSLVGWWSLRCVASQTLQRQFGQFDCEQDL